MLAEASLRPEILVRRWAELAEREDTPDYYELNEFGELIMSPRPSNDHQRIVQAVVAALERQLGPEAVAEVSVLTDRGVRVPDVVWMPSPKWTAAKGMTPMLQVPEICVEVLSPGNTAEEIAMKVAAYLRGGACEVIVIDLKGQVDFFGPKGARTESAVGVKLNLDPGLF